MKPIAILILLLLAGCVQDDWGSAAGRHACTDAQMEKVSRETLFCKKEAGYIDTYCYSTAIMRNCVPKDKATAKGALSQDSAQVAGKDCSA